MKLINLVGFAVLLATSGMTLADSLTVDAAVGGGIGGALGGAAGAEIGGREGAIIGSAAGAAIGSAINTQGDYPDKQQEGSVIRVEPAPRHRLEPSRFCPPGQAKKGRC